MKKVKILMLAVITGLFASCDLELVKDYAFDTNPDGLKDRNAIDYFETEVHQDATTFCKVVKYAEMVDEFTNTPDVTIVIPNNNAFENLYVQMGVDDYTDLAPEVWRSLLKYLIFPGDYRAITMEPNVNVECTTLSGDPIWIKRSPSTNNKYRIVINDNSDRLSSASIPVNRQDYYFKNNIVAQVVGTFVYYQPIVTPSDDKPADVDMSGAPIDSLMVTDDSSIYYGSKGTNYDKKEIQVVGNRSSAQRYGLAKFQLKPVSFIDNLVAAQIRLRISQTNTTAYKPGQTLALGVYKIDSTNWEEETVIYNDIQTAKWPLAAGRVYAGTVSFEVPEGSTTSSSNSLKAYRENPAAAIVKTDITSTIQAAYETAATDGSTPIAFAFVDETSDPAVNSSYIYICSKDCTSGSSYVKDTMRIYLIGPTNSAMTMLRNQAVTTTNGNVVLTPDNSFAMQGPATPNGYSYTSNNIIYILAKTPEKGFVTRFGIPMAKNSKFTQAEMEAGVIKYLKSGDGSDSFQIKASDYIGGLYFDAQNSALITVNID